MRQSILINQIMGIALVCCFSNPIKAQTNFIYGKQFGSDKGGFGFNTVADKWGNVFIAGETNGPIGNQFFGKSDGFVSKYDSVGNMVWTTQIGTSEEDKINWIAVDPIGNVYATGFTKGVANERNLGKEDILIVKLDTNGHLEWQKQVGTDSTDMGNMICMDAKGAIYVAATTRGKMDEIAYGEEDGIIIKFDDKGNIIWKKQFGTARYDECKGIATDGASTIYVCGATAGDLASVSKGQWDSFIATFTDKGEPLRMFQFGTTGYDMASHIIIDKEKNLYIGGSTSGDFGGKQQGEGDAFLSKLNKNFELIWTEQFGTAKWDGVNGMALNEDVSENIVISGCQNWPSCQAFIRMYQHDGHLVWVNNYVASGKNGGTCGKGVCIDANGNIYHTGGTGGNLFKNIDKPEGDDVYLMKIGFDKSLK